MNQEEPTTRPVYRDHGHPVLALVFIAAGTIILMQNFHILNGDVWSSLWRLWPLILVLWGIQAIFGRSRIGSLIVFIIGLAILGLVVSLPMLGITSVGRWHWGSVQEQSQKITVDSKEYVSATSRDVRIDNGIGKVEVTDSGSSQLFDWNAAFASGFEPDVQHSLEGTTARVRINTRTYSGLSWLGRPSPHYVLNLGRPTLPTSLYVDSGVGEVVVTLDQTVLTDLNVHVGTGSANVTLSESAVPANKSYVQVGTGSGHLSLPSGIGLKLHYDVGLGSIHIFGNEMRGNGTYTSPGYDNATKKLELQADIGTGSLEVVK